MFKKYTLKNGLTVINIPRPFLDSVTVMVVVGAGSRYETKETNGISHFLEHMFFKGSKKYPTTELISSLIDGIGAINNAATYKELTTYWIKSSAKHIGLALDILSSQIKESLLSDQEIERERGVIVEEMRMINDDPSRLVHYLYENLLFGNQPLGWDLVGSEETVGSITRKDIVDYVNSLYSPKNMVLVLAGNIPKNSKRLVTKYFDDLPKRNNFKAKPYKKTKQSKLKVAVFYKKTDQVHLILGVEAFDQFDDRKYISRVLSSILGEGMSSRLFLQVRERRGLAYSVWSDSDSYADTGSFITYAGLKQEKVFEGLEVIKSELLKVAESGITSEELKKAKDMIAGRLALRSESTNFLAEYFGVNFILEGRLQTIEQYLREIDKVTAEDVLKVAKELFKKERFNLQVIGPFKSAEKFEKVLNS